MNFQSRWIFSLTIILSGLGGLLNAQGIIMNEASNGSSGSQEFFELVVVGATPTTSCASMDLREWIFDDNNGDFSGGASSGEGIATGHARFRNVPAWASIPVGSIILLFNPLDKNTNISLADDPYDANNDSIYVIPLSNPDLEFCTQSPSVPSTSNSSFTCSAYSSFLSSSSTRRWDAIQMRNGGDAAQTRQPNGSFFHGFSYGSGGGLGTGGPDAIHIGNSSGSGTTFLLDNSTDNDWSNGSNYSRAAAGMAAETPGGFNSAANETWIKSIRCPTPLPVEITYFGAKAEGEFVVLNWTTASEIQNREFVIERSGQDGIFETVGTVSGAGTTSMAHDYEFTDHLNGPARRYYRLRQVDFDGAESFSKVTGVISESQDQLVELVYPNPAYDQITFLLSVANDPVAEIKVELYDLKGQLVKQASASAGNGNELGLRVSDLQSGLYLYRAMDRKNMRVQSGKIQIR